MIVFAILWYALLFYDILWFSLLFFDIRWYSMIFSDILWHSMIFFAILWYSTVFSDILWYSLIFYDILWYSMVFYASLWYSLIFYDYMLLYFLIFYDILWHCMMLYHTDYTYYNSMSCIVLFFNSYYIEWCFIIAMPTWKLLRPVIPSCTQVLPLQRLWPLGCNILTWQDMQDRPAVESMPSTEFAMQLRKISNHSSRRAPRQRELPRPPVKHIDHIDCPEDIDWL